MYGVLSAQRGAQRRSVPRLGPDGGFALDLAGHAADAWPMPRSSGSVRPTTRPGRPRRGPPSRPSSRRAQRSRAAGRPSSSTRRTTSSIRHRSSTCASDSLPSSSCARSRRPSPCQGCGSATRWRRGRRSSGSSASARPAASPRSPRRVAAAALRRPELAAANARAIGEEREWLAAGLAAIGLPAVPERHELPALPRSGRRPTPRPRPSTCSATASCRAPSGPITPLSGHLRFTVRDRPQDERLLEVLGAWMDGRSR